MICCGCLRSTYHCLYRCLCRCWCILRGYNRENMYLLVRDDTFSTNEFVRELPCYIDARINIIRVDSLNDCTESYPIALLITSQSRAADDINATLADTYGMEQQEMEEFYNRTVVIYLHIITNTKCLPKAPTTSTITGVNNVATILEFALNVEDRVCDSVIYVCPYDGRRNSSKALADFILKRKYECTENSYLITD